VVRGNAARVRTVAVTMVVAALALLAFTGLALGSWPDLPVDRLDTYGVGESALAAISQGFPDGDWRPYDLMTRGQFLQMAVKQFALPPADPTTPSYTDVAPGDAVYPAVEAATAAGLISGRSPGIFDPAGSITRQQAASIIARRLATLYRIGLASYYSDARALEIVRGFHDGGDANPNVLREVAYAAEKGILQGSPDGSLHPYQTLTRIQGAVFLVRAGQLHAGSTTSITSPFPTTVTFPTTTGTGPGAIAGTVSPAVGGFPWAAAVNLLHADGTHPAFVYANSDGSFRFAGLDPGDYKLSAHVWGSDYIAQWYRGLAIQTHSVADASLIHVGSAEERVDMVLHKGRAISGRVTWSGAKPGYIGISVHDSGGREIDWTSVMYGGVYLIQGLVPGVYTLAASPDFDRGPIVFYQHAATAAGATAVDVTGSDATDIDIYLGVLPSTTTSIPGTTIPGTTSTSSGSTSTGTTSFQTTTSTSG
jgi:hypothetical protein